MSSETQALHELPWTGERYLPEISGSIELEHLHRYFFACKFVEGKRVLDIACGEGYGSNLLAKYAHQIIGVDIAEEAVQHARHHYQQKNMEFRVGSATDIPLADGSVDVVVSFETIEHHTQHEEMMREIKRVLTPGGLLIISSPNKLHYTIERGYSNPFHPKELFTEEFDALVRRYFSNACLLGQRVVFGSIIIKGGGGASFQSWSADTVQEGLLRPIYDLIVASNETLPTLPSSLFEIMQDGYGMAECLESSIVRLNQEVMERNVQIAELSRAVQALRTSYSFRVGYYILHPWKIPKWIYLQLRKHVF